MKKIALIPARIESKRFYGKLLEKLSGVPIILRTYQSALETNVFDDVFVVTHNDEIIDLMKSINGKYLKSSSDHESGTDRIAEVSIDLQYDIIVNLQGDEPFIDKLSIEKLVNEFNDKEVQMASLMRNFNDKDELNNPNNVKVIVDKDYYSINFSRIPMNSDTDNYKHIGVYAFRKETLIEFSKMEKTIMEKKEKIECLRYIENGKKIKMVKTDFSGISIDTPEDLIRAVVPHSSYFDFIVAVLTRTILNKRIKFLGKKELFNPLTGLIFKFWGGIPIDREINKNYVETIVELINKNKINHLAIAPEGTREKVEKWKTGFYYIAHQSRIPIMMTSFDYKNKTVILNKAFYTSGDIEKDFEFLRDKVSSIEPRK